MLRGRDAIPLQKLLQVNRPSRCRDMGLLKSPLQQNTLNTLCFSRGTCHDRHLDALRVVNYGVEGMGLSNKEDRSSIGPAVAEIQSLSKEFQAGPGRSYCIYFSTVLILAWRTQQVNTALLLSEPTIPICAHTGRICGK